MIDKDEIKSVAFPKNLLKEIDEFREKNFFKQFSPAILYLVHLGLQYHQKMQQDNRPMIFTTPPTEYPQSPLYPATWTIPSGANYMWYTGNTDYGTAGYTGNINYG